MEILFITHKYPPGVGGMEKQSFELTQRMQKHAAVHLLCCDGSESKWRFFRLLKQRIREKLRQHPGISVLHFNDGLAAAFCSGAYDFPGLVRAVTVHGLDVVFPNFFFQRYMVPRLNRFDAVIAVSQATARACVQRGIAAEKISVIPNGVDHDIAFFKPALAAWQTFQEKYQGVFEGQKTLILMGRPVRRKGFSWFLEHVFPRLPAGFQALLIGPFREKRPLSVVLLHLLPPALRKQIELAFGLPSDEDALRALLHSPALRGRVRHLGKLPFEEVMQLMSAADAFVMPNIPVPGDMEGFGLVCLEANLRGLPVFAAGLEGITEAVQHEKNGWLIPSGDADAWLRALNRLEREPAAVRTLGQQARQYVLEHFGWEQMTAAYYDLFATRSHRR